jgi:hypothetical protein
MPKIERPHPSEQQDRHAECASCQRKCEKSGLAGVSTLLQGENPKCQYVPQQSPMAHQLLKALDIRHLA